MKTIYLINKRQFEREAAYEAALLWIDRLEPPRLSGRGEALAAHLYSADGKLLQTLDEVVRAALNDDLAFTNKPVMELAA